MARYQHRAVLLQKAIHYLNIQKGEKYIDATVGGGGHAELILKKGGDILGIDYDPEAIEAAREHLSQACPSRRSSLTLEVGTNVFWLLTQGNFADLCQIAQKHGFTQVAGILFDLGVSSYQLDHPERGFSFSSEGVLDMRMDPSLKVMAADLINGLKKGELNELFFKLGQERHSRRLAEAIVNARQIKPIKTTKQLADLIVKEKSRQRKIHPATQVFQALRIAVNDELNNLKKALPEAVELLKPKGRLVVISFHSGEDRIVKHFFKQENLAVLTKKPVRPDDLEIKENPRSRSAKLRAAQKI